MFLCSRNRTLYLLLAPYIQHLDPKLCTSLLASRKSPVVKHQTWHGPASHIILRRFICADLHVKKNPLSKIAIFSGSQVRPVIRFSRFCFTVPDPDQSVRKRCCLQQYAQAGLVCVLSSRCFGNLFIRLFRNFLLACRTRPGRGARPDKVDPTLGDSGFFKVWNRIIVYIRKNDPKTSRAFLSVTWNPGGTVKLFWSVQYNALPIHAYPSMGK